MKTKLEDLWNYAGDRKEALMNELIYYVPIGKAGESHGTPLQYSCLENPMDGGAW